MSRITPPVTKFTHAMRGISSSASVARPSTLLNSNSRYLPRSIQDLKTECSKRQLKITGSKAELVDRLTAHDFSRSHSTIGGHRPSTPSLRTIPLMQGFRTSVPKQAAHDNSTIDFFFLPEIPEPPPINPFSQLRVPLLPDNYNPDRSPNSPHAPESLDEAVPGSEILIVASHPEHVLPAALTEVVRNEAIDADLEELTKGFQVAETDEDKPGILKELWTGLIDDILGAKTPKPVL